jgi:formate dehydrogenase iron-sulfur subunit
MTISRRRFMGWIGAAAAGTLVPKIASGAKKDRNFPIYQEGFGVLHDITRCIGCRKCEAACNRVSSLPSPERPFDDLTVLNEGRRTHTGAFTVVNRYSSTEFNHEQTFNQMVGTSVHQGSGQGNVLYVKTQCNHCLEPACASACFVKAFTKNMTGAVTYDASLCVGCRYCMIACPFNVPTYEYNQPLTPRIRKCDLCHNRVIQGLPPGCVAECPKEALSFGPRHTLLDMARRRIISHPGRYIPHIYGEREMGGTSWLYLSGVPFSTVGMREDLGDLPASAFTAGVLGAIPIVVGLWPVLLTGIYVISKRKDDTADKAQQNAVAAALAKARDQSRMEMENLKKKYQTEKEAAIQTAVKNALADKDQNESPSDI